MSKVADAIRAREAARHPVVVVIEKPKPRKRAPEPETMPEEPEAQDSGEVDGDD